MSKQYLGDGAYYECDGFGVMLTTENGISTTNAIYLEPEVIASLLKALATNYDPEKLKSAIGGAR